MKHHGDLEGSAVAIGVALTADQVARLERFEDLLAARAVPLGLISSRDQARLRSRHVLDSLRSAAVVEVGDAVAYDLGSGAGLPGIVVAIARPTLEVALVEIRRKAVAFLELAVENLALANVSVWAGKLEDIRDPADLCFARGLAPLEECWNLARGLIRPGGRLVYFAGRHSRLAETLPGSPSVSLLESPVLASSGPLVIMARQ